MKRNTKQKEVLLSVLRKAKIPLSAQEVWERAKDEAPKIGLATIYRLLEEFFAEGALKTVEMQGKAKKYALITPQHCHYFTCLRCDQLFPIHKCPPNLAALLPPNFTIEAHEILLSGHCSECQ